MIVAYLLISIHNWACL